MNALIDLATVALLVVGCFFVLLGGLALVKLSTFFNRIHGPTKASTLGVGCILVASILYHTVHGSGLHPRELLITVFLFLTAPVAAHMMSLAGLALMDDRPKEPSTRPDPEGHIRDDADERADQRERERIEDEQEAARKATAARDATRGG